MLEDQLLDDFGGTLRAQALEALAEQDQGNPLATDIAISEAMLGYLEEAGAIAGHDLCPHEDQGMRRPCRILGYSLPEDSTRLDLFTAAYVPPDGPANLPSKEVARLSGWAARFFEYAAKGDHDRFSGNPAAAGAATLIREEIARIEDVRVHLLTCPASAPLGPNWRFE